MRRFTRSPLTGMAVFALALTPGIADDNDHALDEAKALFGMLNPVPETSTTAPDAELGRALFWDERLSANGRTACASCHQAADWGADRRRFSPDARGRNTPRNSQTVFNAMMQPALRWTGDRSSGAHQAEKSLTGSMGFATADEVVPLLRQHGYDAAFKKAWPTEADPVTPSNYAKALQAYQATLVTPSAFDRFLGGDKMALNPRQRRGLEVFMSESCTDCHKGELIGGRGMRKFGIERPYWEATRSEKRDAGLFETTKRDEDREKFRVPMLRNIEKTGPYFHDGSVAELQEAVQVMAELQAGGRLADEDADAVVEFLRSLTGSVPAHYSAPEKAGD